jgi:hypothetical protein
MTLPTNTLNNHSPNTLQAQDTQPSLVVKRVFPDEYSKILKIAGNWAEMARRKMQIVPDHLPAWRQFRSSKNIGLQTKRDLLELMKDPDRELYVCQDATGNVQGIVIGTKKGNVLWGHRLMTNPVNIRCEANELEPGRVQGVARAFFRFLDQEAPRRGVKAIFFQPTESAVPFYERFGFHFPARKSGNLMIKRLTPAKL